MTHHNRFDRIVAFLLMLTLCGSLLPPSASIAADNDTIVLRNANDLEKLARNCALDTWSQGKTVILENDIHLNGTDFAPIPTFGGTFEGNGYTISGLHISGGTACQGFFRYVQEGAVVRDLHIAGSITAEQDQKMLGGIAGENSGTIADCSFQGTITGKTQVGGIAGCNMVTGSIYRCTSKGNITGERNTGGISGENSGIITGCLNQSTVNTIQQEHTQDLNGTLRSTLDALQKEDILNTTTDTGGIAGYSNGILRDCSNEAQVGYPHLGYNVGGIVGRSSGYLENCSNHAEILGRKDVGGIAGQLAPNIRLVFTPDRISQLDTELNRLKNMVDATMDHTDANGDIISDRLEQISGYTSSATDSISELSNTVADWLDGNTDTINDASETLADTLDRLALITADGESILDQTSDGIDRLEDCLNTFAAAMGMGEDGLNDMADALGSLRRAVRQAKNSINDVQQAIHNLSQALVIKDPAAVAEAKEQLDVAGRQLIAALQQCNSALEQLAQLFLETDTGAVLPQKEIAECLKVLAQGYLAASQAAGQIHEAILLGASGIEVDQGQLQESIRAIQSALSGFSDSLALMDRSLAEIQDACSSFAGMSGTVENGLYDLSSTMDVFEDVFRRTGDVLAGIHDLFQDLADREPIQLDKLGDDFHQAEDDLNGAVTGLQTQMDALRSEMDATRHTLSSDLHSISDQFQVISDLFMDALDETQEKEADAIWDDVSEQVIDSTTLGKARNCTNDGAIAGDRNVGGIAGTMAVEFDLDPEDDVTEVGEKSLNFRYETRAILQRCRNTGAVTAKKEAAGGMVGHMELGYLLECENYGPIETTDGNYTGGIAGYSDSTIRSCWSKCFLTGNGYVGGIAGYGYKLAQCISFVSVSEAQGYTGSIAGDWDRESGTLYANYFVENPLAGVDGISYSGGAEPISYASLLQKADLPAPFRQLTVTYVADEQIIDRTTFSYGDALIGLTTPSVPAKEGYTGAWEDPGETNITFDHVLHAIYTPCITTLASQAMRDDVRAVFLMEGNFDSHALLQVKQNETADPHTEQWQVSLEGATADERHLIRFAPPAEWKHVSLCLLTADGPKAVKAETCGSYLLFSVDSDSFVLQASEGSGTSFLWCLPLIGGILLIAAVFAGRKRQRNRNTI